ncbi:hypothetical protein WJ0W_002635 [Paenibacillus melissococcoides]|uniref:Uncharacterized protein n=1 Tax=Paenibacillus melissococcoides TaxID=2912268 RepID=A0ABM9G1C9_9BACL|nr:MULTISPECIES: hypothetical protein [Paenibacillus]MEB9892407.1 hypothetical protein [Bacillus cereus]CAH8245400.1 hypothetical protein WJ0W_002635 [Paenibacillus melissococcoides]CAH8710831.1 hypothetical protein WDD9_002715 [Paenibacillus melissococcoides]CAH8711634.1 hypothetical protein HTL2_003016 [Paenibacillus melissococcoides]
MEELHRKFIARRLPFKNTIHEVEKMLKVKYLAEEIPKSSLTDLHYEMKETYNKIVKCFKIEDEKILQRVCSNADKKLHEEYTDGRSSNSLETEWSKINSGKLLRVILISDDGKTMSNYKVQGICTALVQDLTIMLGISPENCSLDNSYYVKYLQLLQLRGYL